MTEHASKNPLLLLPDFESHGYRRIILPSEPKLLAWTKARESERRLTWYRWVEVHNDQANPKHLTLLNDGLSAFLLSFEAAIQQAKDQCGPVLSIGFDGWLKSQPESDELLRGIRTLRHLDAHVESKSVVGHVKVVIGGSPSFSRRWALQSLGQSDLNRLHSRLLAPADLPKWNMLIESSSVTEILGRALDRLNSILHRLDALA